MFGPKFDWVRDADMFPFGFPPGEGFEKDFVGMVGMGGHLSICQADFGPATPTMMLRMPKVVKKRKSLGKCRAAGMVDSCFMSAFNECFGLKQQKDVACSDCTSSKYWL